MELEPPASLQLPAVSLCRRSAPPSSFVQLILAREQKPLSWRVMALGGRHPSWAVVMTYHCTESLGIVTKDGMTNTTTFEFQGISLPRYSSGSAFDQWACSLQISIADPWISPSLSTRGSNNNHLERGGTYARELVGLSPSQALDRTADHDDHHGINAWGRPCVA